jgi:RNA polymerase sigma factor (sigma-70 family)
MRRMFSTIPTCKAEPDDSSLVGASLKGDRDAFAHIVARYQGLISSIAYSATGNLNLSEDLAQETFLAAWKGLSALQEPEKLRSWLCGIARRVAAGCLRNQHREPAHGAEPLESLADAHAPEAIPVERAISREEQAILWRSLEQIPASYREPLILFYRENQSTARVAQALELSEDAVRQRLSRGRKLLEERVAAFVEGALKQSAPGNTFTLGVIGALPLQMASVGSASAGLAAAKAGAAAKTAAWLAILNSCAGLFAGSAATWLGYRIDMASATSEQQKRLIKRFYLMLVGCIVFPIALMLGAIRVRAVALTHPALYSALVIMIVVSWVPLVASLLLWAKQRFGAENNAAFLPGPTQEVFQKGPAFEFRTGASFLGLPLIHIRFGGAWAVRQTPVKGWIAVGDIAFGGIFALGAVAVAPVCLGGLSLGGIVFAGFGAGLVCYAGFGVGVWALGGLVAGLVSIGGCAVGWKAAVGGIAIAHELAQGGVAVALHANDSVATDYINSSKFFGFGFALLTKWIWPTVLIATLPSALMWWVTQKRRQS